MDVPALSLCLIARNSSRTLAACLASIRPWVDEMIVVDTGSDDDTREIARSLGAQVFEFCWCDDFSAARNESLRHARGRWLFWMDSDDTIDDANGRRLRELAHQQHPAGILGFVMQVHCPGPPSQDEAGATVVDHVKLLRNLPELIFDGRIHEQVLPAIRRMGGDVAWTDIHVVHSGSDQSPVGKKRKQERDLRILLLENAERPGHPFTLFNLGMTYADIGEHEQAIGFLRRSIATSGGADSHLRKAYALLVASHVQLQQTEQATEVCNEGRRLFPTDPELLFRSGVLAHQQRQYARAASAYLQLLERRQERHFSSIDPTILGFKAHQNLAVVYRDMGRHDLAELQWRKVGGEMPDYQPGLRGLVETLLTLGRHETASIEIDRLLASEKLRGLGLLLAAALAEKRGDLTEAKRRLSAAIREQPDDTEPLEALCKFLFDHGTPDEAKTTLERLADRLPNDGAVLHNLGAVNTRLGDYAAAVHAYQASLDVRPHSPATRRELGLALGALTRNRASELAGDGQELTVAASASLAASAT